MAFGDMSNVGKGNLLRDKVRPVLAARYGVEFLPEQAMPIGDPPKEHKFDLISVDRRYVAECKSYSWRKTDKADKTPRAKMKLLNDAVSELSYLPSNIKKLLVMRKDVHPLKHETLAQYYKRLNRNRLDEVLILEFDLQTNELTEI